MIHEEDVCLECGAKEGEKHNPEAHGADAEMERRREDFRKRMADSEN